MISVAIDAMGGDFGCEPIINGVVDALRERKFNAFLVGDEASIKPFIPQGYGFEKYITYVAASEVFEMKEGATDVLKRKESSIFKELSVEENLMLAAEITYKNKAEASRKVDEMLNLLNIEPIRLRKGVSLSGGERRRCEIARSLMITPKFLLLDEPFAGVDPIAVNDIQSIVRDLKKLGIGVLITDHNVRETLAICDRAYVIKDGELFTGGTAKEIASDPNVRKFYLGEDFSI